MLIKNTETKYGITAKLLHWIIAILFVVQYILIFWVKYMLPENSPTSSLLITELHEPIGMTIFVLGILAIIWRLNNVKPLFPFSMPNWEKCAATTVHILLYVTIIIMPLSGLLMAVAGGHPPSYFGLFTVPAFLPVNKTLSNYLFNVHEITAIAIIVLVIIHTLAALKHHFINRDNVLKRMLWN